MQLSVVIPVHNEAANIAVLCREIRAVLESRHTYEVIVVDDGSTDQTLAVLGELARELAVLRVLRHHRRYGQSSALYSGIRHANYDVVVTLDGDGQNDPRDIRHLLETYRATRPNSAPVVVTGIRRQRQDSSWRRFSSKVANAVRSRLLGDQTPDTGCGLKVLPRDLFLALPRFDHMHRFLPALARQAGAMLVSVEVHHRPRRHGHSHYGTLNRLGTGVIDLAGVLWLSRRSMNPKLERMDRHHEP